MPSVVSSPPIKLQFFDDDGAPLAAGKLYTYEAGTSTNKATYSDATGSSANANPIVLDSAGRCSMYLASGSYKFYLTDSEDAAVWTEDNVTPSTVTTSVDTVDDLKALVGGSSPMVQTLGYSAVNDGGGWLFYWDSDSSASDDGGMVIQPDSLPATGRWIGLLPSNKLLNVRCYGAACDGVTDDFSELSACVTWCDTNNCAIFIDDDIYIDIGEDPSITTKLHLHPGAKVIYPYDFNPAPTLYPVIDASDGTQHFTCDASHAPYLYTSYLKPAWFGDTNFSDSVTSAAITNHRSSDAGLYVFGTT